MKKQTWLTFGWVTGFMAGIGTPHVIMVVSALALYLMAVRIAGREENGKKSS